MANLLNKSEQRRLQYIEILSQANDWVSFTDLSEQLVVSRRLVKEDLNYLREKFTFFRLDTDNDSIRISYQQNKELKNVYQYVLNESPAYQLLEAAFLNEGASLSKIGELLFMSHSTIYRLIQKINESLAQYDFEINSTPFSISGNEDQIRNFFYRYFYEKYTFTAFPFKDFDEKTFDDFLTFHINLTQLNNDFAYYSKFKTIIFVNLIRFKNNHFIDSNQIELNYQSAVPDLTPYAHIFQEFEQAFDIDYDEFAIKQLFGAYVQDSFSLDYDHLMQRVAEDAEVAAEVTLIERILNRLAQAHDLPIPNIEQMVSALRNIIHLDYLEHEPHYILYDRDNYFVEGIRVDYPTFYRSLYEAMKELRHFLGKPLTEAGINFYIYTVFTYWRGLVPKLRDKREKIRVIILSDRHVTHAKMIKAFISFEFSEQIEIDIYTDIALNKEILEDLDCDLLVSNFLLPDLTSKGIIYIKNVPDYHDLDNLQNFFYQLNQNNRGKEV